MQKSFFVRSLLWVAAVSFYAHGGFDGRTDSYAANADTESETRANVVIGLVEALKDDDAGVRKNAALALGQMGDEAEAAVGALIATLKDADVDVRGAAAVTLGHIGPKATASRSPASGLSRCSIYSRRGTLRPRESRPFAPGIDPAADVA